jgi:hypothetical protein
LFVTGILSLLLACQSSSDSAEPGSGDATGNGTVAPAGAAGASSSATQLYAVRINEGMALADEIDDVEATDKGEPSAADLQACSDYFGKSVAAVKVAGHSTNIALAPTDLLAVRVTGSHNLVDVAITAIPADGEAEPEVEAESETEAEAETNTDTATATSTATNTATDTEQDGSLEAAALAGSEDEAAATSEQADQAAEEQVDESERPRFAGVCFFLAGTQASAKIAIDGFTLGKFGFIARGNDATGELDVMADAAVDDVFVDIGRNDASLSIIGEGSFECPDVDGVVCPE